MSRKYQVGFVLRLVIFLLLALLVFAIATMPFEANALPNDFFSMEDEVPLITNEQSDEGVAIENSPTESFHNEVSATEWSEVPVTEPFPNETSVTRWNEIL